MAKADATRALLKTRWSDFDEYVGTADQLSACGLVQPEQFPGQPGRGKVTATYFLADGQPVPRGCGAFEPTYTVERVSSTRFSVLRYVSDQEAKRRASIPGYRGGRLPLDLPKTPAVAASSAPAWMPAGFEFRRRRESDWVFLASTDHLRQSGIMEARPLPQTDNQARKTIRFCSQRFGRVTVAWRTAQTYFVVLNIPREVRNAAYEAKDLGWGVHHRGTKQQLQARGLGVGVGFPGEPGCNRRKVTLLASGTGSEVRIELLRPSDWFGEVPRFEVIARRSGAEMEALQRTMREAEVEKGRLERLKKLPATPEQFRDDLADSFWTWVNFTKAQMQQRDGYRLAADVVDEFIDTATEAYWTIKNGQTVGCSPRETWRRVVCANAQSDQTLQRFMASTIAMPAPPRAN